MATTTTTRVFNNGNSQAVRIPREYRIDSSTVQIFRNDNGDLVLHPIPDQPEKREARLLDILNRLKRAGTPIGGNDLWIACHALSIDATLVTNNTREFSRIDGLLLENWVE